MAITQLVVINAMLASLGMSPLTAQDTQHPRYIQALAKLNELDGDFQGSGWWFNRTVTTLTADGGGAIALPATALHVDPVDVSKVYVMRDAALYNLTDETATFEVGEEVICNVVYQLTFDELPPLAQVYLKDRARHDFYLDADGAEPKLTRYARMAETSWTKLRVEHLKNADVNFFTGTANAFASTRQHINYR